MDFLRVLDWLERNALPGMLRDAVSWSGKEMRFFNPEGELRMVRLERPWPRPLPEEVLPWVPEHARNADAIVRLHHFFPTREGEEIMHHHRWPGAMRLLSGRYLLGFGRSEQETGWPGPPREIHVDLRAPSAYAMEHPDVWHSLRIVEETKTLVLGFADWPQRNRHDPPNRYEKRRFEREEVEDALRFYRERYP